MLTAINSPSSNVLLCSRKNFKKNRNKRLKSIRNTCNIFMMLLRNDVRHQFMIIFKLLKHSCNCLKISSRFQLYQLIPNIPFIRISNNYYLFHKNINYFHLVNSLIYHNLTNDFTYIGFPLSTFSDG